MVMRLQSLLFGKWVVVLNTFMRLQTVFFDLRKPVLEEMYQHHVESARMNPLLAQLDTALGDICAAANDSLHAYLARSLLQAITVALQRILLDGGPYRSAAHSSVLVVLPV